MPEKIIALRNGAGLSQEAFGALIGLAQQSVHKLETGKRSLAVDELLLLSQHLCFSIDEFLSSGGLSPEALFRARVADLSASLLKVVQS
ncbi:helix-turn-helix transcriptional regulator [Subtercola endophyticus]|uniref:helix-turn-helix transcriptional regulator n=1 Tax=Subtercola endophyticus TaxID=2895559 RepID=UPI001E38D98B|nr:helix-turn-helix transcriptional regulator [Subtercola endophyticus]UFS59507.1 helix-turn-helix domain-containing protein [Subtercola endophyticus]